MARQFVAGCFDWRAAALKLKNCKRTVEKQDSAWDKVWDGFESLSAAFQSGLIGFVFFYEAVSQSADKVRKTRRPVTELALQVLNSALKVVLAQPLVFADLFGGDVNTCPSVQRFSLTFCCNNNIFFNVSFGA